MHQIYDYDVYIFDCDGVILDSNVLKIEAMRTSLLKLNFPLVDVDLCVDFFRSNFGKSRFYHVEQFIERFLVVDELNQDDCKASILSLYSLQCKQLYLTAELTPGFIGFISSLNGEKYVASGSEQQELRDVFKERGLTQYFENIFGSPIKKSDLINSILSRHTDEKTIMIGDAISDYEASKQNEIDFVCYIPFSNVKEQMMQRSNKYGFQVLEQWPSID
jgi:phosphoglycolate phosphatase-like HAD superfamily hydrolase